MASLTCGCGVGSNDVKCRWHAQQDTLTTAVYAFAVDERCSLPCQPMPPDHPPNDADEHYGSTEYWTCLKHGSHTGRRRYLAWERNGQRFGWWEWADVS